jgi:prepilin-type N-terminal cleavage/methylation domain-containing protein
MLPKAPDAEGGRDSGFTIIELLVTMLITGIVLAMMGTFFANIARLTNWSGNDRTATGQAAVAIDSVRAVVRTAVKTSDTAAGAAVQYASPTKLQLVAYSDVNKTTANPQLVTFCLVGGVLKENTQTGIAQDTATKAWTFPNPSIVNTDCTSPTGWTTVASGFSMSATPPFFTYLDTKSQALNASPSVSPTDRTANVTFIQVVATLDATRTSGSGKPVVVTSAIGMPGVTRDVDPTATVPNLPTPTETPTPTPTPTFASSSATSTPTSSTTPTSGSSGGSGTGTGSGSGSGTGPGTSSPGTGTGGTGGSTGGGSGTSTPAPSTSSPKPTATASATPTPTKTPTVKPTPPQVIDY